MLSRGRRWLELCAELWTQGWTWGIDSLVETEGKETNFRTNAVILVKDPYCEAWNARLNKSA